MIIEGLLTTTDASGGPHVAALGPVVDEALQAWLLRPFQSSTTFQRLRSDPICIFHVIDDVLPVVRAALGLEHEIACQRHPGGGWLVNDACHWYKLEVRDWNLDSMRAEGRAVVVDRGTLRPFWGWNRAKHAVLEAAILASRLHLLDAQSVAQELARLQTAVDKTAGPRELQAWSLVTGYVAARRGDTCPATTAADARPTSDLQPLPGSEPRRSQS